MNKGLKGGGMEIERQGGGGGDRAIDRGVRETKTMLGRAVMR